MLRITLFSLLAFFFVACSTQVEDPLLEEAIAERATFAEAFPYQVDKVYVASKEIKTASGQELVVQTKALNATHWIRTEEGTYLPNHDEIFATLDMKELGTYRGEEVVEHRARIVVMDRAEWEGSNSVESIWPPCISWAPQFCHLFYNASLTSAPWCPCLMLCSTNGIFLNAVILIPCRNGVPG